ncbi:MAG: hypothetical protein IT279_00730, partial [Ignavibacteriaceae bacterium]|nr:hypothetical protein [Ignavibacteriaceae bacterium]
AGAILRLLLNKQTDHISDKLVKGILDFMIESSDVSGKKKTELRRQMEALE